MSLIKINLRFGNVSRLRIAEISNWSGVLLAAPRTDLEFLLERDEMTRAGVYLLIGESKANKQPQAYVGEAENVRERLKQHSEKDFWIAAYVLTDKDQSLTKAHIRYLEGRLISEAKHAGRYEIQNTQGSGAKLPEAEKEMVEVYLSWAGQLLLALGCDLLTLSAASQNTKPDKPTVVASDFAQALEALRGKITSKQRELLQIHYRADKRKLTARQMAERAGYGSYAAANLHYGRLGRLVGEQLRFKEENCHIGVLVEFIRPDTEGNSEWIWVMRPGLAKALETLRWL